MRLYNQVVFEGWVVGTSEVFNDARFNELLGRADRSRVQIDVEDGTSSPTLTAKWYPSNDNTNWDTTGFTSLWSTSVSVPSSNFTNGASPNFAFGRIGLAVAAGQKVFVRITVCGRAFGR